MFCVAAGTEDSGGVKTATRTRRRRANQNDRQSSTAT